MACPLQSASSTRLSDADPWRGESHRTGDERARRQDRLTVSFDVPKDASRGSTCPALVKSANPEGLARCSYRPPLPKDRPRSREGTLMARRSQGGQPPNEALPNPKILGVSSEPEQRSLAPLRFLPSRRSPLLNLERSSRTNPDHPRRGREGASSLLRRKRRTGPGFVRRRPRHPDLKTGGLLACLRPFGAGTGGRSRAQLLRERLERPGGRLREVGRASLRDS
jgi:hypothetical protein